MNRTAEPDDHVTQFEALTAAAYHELARRGVEVAVIEAGLGGRFDATNVIPSKVQVLTSVGLEHTRWLGPTLDGHRRRRSWRWCATTATLVVGDAGARGPRRSRRRRAARAPRRAGRRGPPTRHAAARGRAASSA